jgi:hypothetical protein
MTMYERWRRTTIANQVMVVLTGLICLATAVNVIVAVIQAYDNARQASRLAAIADGIKTMLENSVRQSKENSEQLLLQDRETLHATLAHSKASLDASIEASRLDQRAWLAVKEVRIESELALNEPLRYSINLVNTGKTPALDVRFVELRSGNNEATIDELAPPRDRGVVAPGNNIKVFGRSNRLDQPTTKAIQDGTIRLYISGTIEYWDIFKTKPRHTRFCVYYPTSAPPNFFNCTDGNTMD